jgi:pimeloyl-ACP methyl ester carboxylesterase
LILETPYYNFVSLVSSHVRILPAFLLLRYRFATNEYLKKATCPIYIFHGTEDFTIPYSHGKRLAESLNLPAQQLITLEGGGHNNLATFPLYEKRMAEILK